MKLLQPLRELWRRPRLYEPGPADLFDIRVELESGIIHRRGHVASDQPSEHGPVLWYGTHWTPALTLCNAFARVAAFAESDRVCFVVLKHRKKEIAAYVTYLFSDHGTMRRILNVQQPGGKPHFTVSEHNYYAPHEVL